MEGAMNNKLSFVFHEAIHEVSTNYDDLHDTRSY